MNDRLLKLLKRNKFLYRTAWKILGIKGVLTYTDAVTMTMEWIKRIPNQYDAVIGIPRQGIFIASIVAGKLNRALSTPDNFLRKEIWQEEDRNRIDFSDIHSVLIVDDSMSTGETLKKAKGRLESSFPNIRFDTAVLHKDSLVGLKTVDNCVIEPDYIANESHYITREWGIFDDRSLSNSGFDLDGVLCENPPRLQIRSEKDYEEWLPRAKPYLYPSKKVWIPAIVTSRNENYREETERWLRDHKIRYDEMYMARDKNEYGFEFKVRIIKKLDLKSFWESEDTEAQLIHKFARVPVLAIESMKIYR